MGVNEPRCSHKQQLANNASGAAFCMISLSRRLHRQTPFLIFRNAEQNNHARWGGFPHRFFQTNTVPLIPLVHLWGMAIRCFLKMGLLPAIVLPRFQKENERCIFPTETQQGGFSLLFGNNALFTPNNKILSRSCGAPNSIAFVKRSAI